MASHSRGLRHHLSRDAATTSAFEEAISDEDDELDVEHLAEAQKDHPAEEGCVCWVQLESAPENM